MSNHAKTIALVTMSRFNDFYRCFLEITQGAQTRFEEKDWVAVQQAGQQRILLYDKHVNQTVRAIREYNNGPLLSQTVLKTIKQAFNDLLINHPCPEIAESFYNSVYRRSFRHRNIHANNLYVHRFMQHSSPQPQVQYWQASHVNASHIGSLVQTTLEQFQLQRPFSDLERDISYVQRNLLEQHPELANKDVTVNFISHLFFRNKGAYLIGSLRDNDTLLPFIIPILHDEQGGLYLDTLILSNDDASILFSFSRAYFMVWCPEPALLIDFLRPLLPSKADHEIYSAIGCQKHGKTEFYRDFLQHLNESRDQFVIAPGIKGMVMSVFTLPSFGVVFKIIKDKFTPPKEVTHKIVKEKYKLVKQHDRVGRMADTMQFTNFELPLHRIHPDLLAELKAVAPSLLTITDHTLTISHLYTERRMTPLNIYLADANEEELVDVIDEYANAIKQLATANIFPGDMLFKNFGVTRHGRVVFYDYDEIAYMTECNFRDIPKARYPEDVMSAEPWYSVAPNDIFPEEFSTFLLTNPNIRGAFKEHHQELFSAQYWRQLQQNIIQGQVGDVYPYPEKHRFKYLYPTTADTHTSTAT